MSLAEIKLPARIPRQSFFTASHIDKPGFLRHYWCVARISSLAQAPIFKLEETMSEFIRTLLSGDEGQDIAEYAVMLAVILVLVVGTIRLIGSNANNVFSNTASSIQ
jgi:Flp pilus assembly pilin Flp